MGYMLQRLSDFRTLLTLELPLHIKNNTYTFVYPTMSIQKHFLFSLGLTSMSDASSFRDAMLAKIVLAQY